MAYCTVADVLQRAPEFANDANSGVIAGGVLDATEIQRVIDESYANVRTCLQPRFDLETVDALDPAPPMLRHLNAIYAAVQLYQQLGPQSADRNNIRITQLWEQQARYEGQISSGLLVTDDGALVPSINGPAVSIAQSTIGITEVYAFGTPGLRRCAAIAPFGGCGCA